MWQVPALLLATTAAVCQDPARETLQTATVIDYVTSLRTAVLMQTCCAVDWTILQKVMQQSQYLKKPMRKLISTVYN